MDYCKKYRKKIKDGMCFCSVCEAGQDGTKSGAGTFVQFDSADIADNKVMAALSYLGLLVLVPLFAARNSRFARFHANQGLALLLMTAAYYIVRSILVSVALMFFWRFSFLVRIIRLAGLAIPVLAIYGIINAANGQAKELPVIGKIKLLK